MKHKIFTLFLAIVASVGTMFAEVYSGNCGAEDDGSNLQWTLNTEDAILTINGTGAMADYWENGAPWASYDESIISIVINEGVTYIGSHAFYDLHSTSVKIPASVTSIGADAFERCGSLLSVYISDLTAWCSIDFSDADSNPLYGVSININNYRKGGSLYLNEELVTNLVIPNTITSIEKYAFFYCGSILSVSIPSSVTIIKAEAFGFCRYLKSVNMSEGITTINERAFYNCEQLQNINIPESIVNIGSYVFQGCSNFPIKNGMMYADTYLVSVIDKDKASCTIEQGTRWIGEAAFAGCEKITTVTIPNSVEDIKYNAFDINAYYTYGHGNNISTIYYTGTVKDWCSKAWYPDLVSKNYNLFIDNTPVIDAFTLPEDLININSHAFYGCKNLISITVPNSVSSIGYDAFYRILNVNYSGNASGAPWGAKCLNGYIEGDLVYDSSDKTILRGCNTSAEGQISIPESVTEISTYAFNYCQNITSVIIPKSVTYIGSYAFQDCIGLNAVYIFDLVAWCALDAFGATTNPLYYAQNLFLNGELVENLVIPDGVRIVGSYAFENCTNIKSIRIPASVTDIKTLAFWKCSNLEHIYMESTTPPTNWSALEEISPAAVVYVKFGYANLYRNNQNWANMNIQVPIEHISTISPTSVNIHFITDGEIVSCGIQDEETFAGNTLEYIGLEPAGEYNDIPVVLTSNTGETETVNLSFTTSALELTTDAPKPVSSNTAVLLASTNMADAEVNCGFEWKRNDAPEDFEATKVFCPVANGTMAGRLKGLKDDVYYKYRAFYQSMAGNMYYGDWKYIFTGDNAVEFDPVLYTYPASAVTETEATLKGYALEGSDDFTEQGFEYWADSRVTSSDAPARKSVIGEKQKIAASGIAMKVTLTDLDEGTVYKYRTYAQFGDQTVYGAEQSFTTKGKYQEPTAVEEMSTINCQLSTEKILRDGHLYILRDGKTYNAHGARVK